ncbi:MAG: flagellar type III secretion system pore protein FliP, partial [Candidatus Methylomirabilis sp.]|nr:flagellar type III secretion system pore protein FliP [Deltaproteobacteria bacterium]
AGAARAAQLPTLSIGVADAEGPEETALAVKIMLLFTVLSLAPAILITLTSFARIVVVFGFLKQALGTGQMPPNQILIALALFLTMVVMGPVFTDIQTNAIEPYMKDELSQEQAFERAMQPLRGFMFSQVRDKDLALFMEISRVETPEKQADLPSRVLIPAFLTSELKTAFQIGFLLYIPFIVIDLIIASALMSMGMMMLPPVFVSLPLKLMLFVMVDGWSLIVGSLVRSFG